MVVNAANDWHYAQYALQSPVLRVSLEHFFFPLLALASSVYLGNFSEESVVIKCSYKRNILVFVWQLKWSKCFVLCNPMRTTWCWSSLVSAVHPSAVQHLIAFSHGRQECPCFAKSSCLPLDFFILTPPFSRYCPHSHRPHSGLFSLQNKNHHTNIKPTTWHKAQPSLQGEKKLPSLKRRSQCIGSKARYAANPEVTRVWLPIQFCNLSYQASKEINFFI